MLHADKTKGTRGFGVGLIVNVHLFAPTFSLLVHAGKEEERADGASEDTRACG